MQQIKSDSRKSTQWTLHMDVLVYELFITTKKMVYLKRHDIPIVIIIHQKKRLTQLTFCNIMLNENVLKGIVCLYTVTYSLSTTASV